MKALGLYIEAVLIILSFPLWVVGMALVVVGMLILWLPAKLAGVKMHFKIG